MAPPVFPRVKLNNRSRNTLLSIGVCIALLAAYYMMIGQEPVPLDTHVSYEVRANGQTTLRVDMLASGITTVTGPISRSDYATSSYAVRRVLMAFHKQKFLDMDVAASSAVPATRFCQLSLTANRRKTSIRYDCAAPSPAVKASLQAFERATNFCDVARRNHLNCAEI